MIKHKTSCEQQGRKAEWWGRLSLDQGIWNSRQKGKRNHEVWSHGEVVRSRGRTRVAMLILALCYSMAPLRSAYKPIPYEDRTRMCRPNLECKSLGVLHLDLWNRGWWHVIMFSSVHRIKAILPYSSGFVSTFSSLKSSGTLTSQVSWWTKHRVDLVWSWRFSDYLAVCNEKIPTWYEIKNWHPIKALVDSVLNILLVCLRKMKYYRVFPPLWSRLYLSDS